MSPVHVYLLAAVALFCLALAALTRRTHLLRRILALNVLGAAVFLVLVSIGYRDGIGARDGVSYQDAAPAPDPVPQAMVLTGIVVAVSLTGLALALARRIARETGRVRLADPDPDRDDGA